MSWSRSEPFKTPWRVDWTNFGESMGYDSKSRIVDTDGRTITQIGNGVSELRSLHEETANIIVNAVNRSHKETAE